MQSRKKLYIGIKCFDSEPDKIIARDMRRDSELEDDDYFQIVIDSYHDLRNGFYFKTNPQRAKATKLLHAKSQRRRENAKKKYS